jgi:hypothetical protein
VQGAASGQSHAHGGQRLAGAFELPQPAPASLAGGMQEILVSPGRDEVDDPTLIGAQGV